MRTMRKPQAAKEVSYKRILDIEAGGKLIEELPEEAVIREYIGPEDLEGLSRLLRMHAKGKIISAKRDTPHTDTNKEWAREKFRLIGQAGKIDMLKHLAKTTGSELRIHMNDRPGKGRPAIAANQHLTKLAYHGSSAVWRQTSAASCSAGHWQCRAPGSVHPRRNRLASPRQQGRTGGQTARALCGAGHLQSV